MKSVKEERKMWEDSKQCLQYVYAVHSNANKLWLNLKNTSLLPGTKT